jgi:predicted SAM-dependent methyltransferase
MNILVTTSHSFLAIDIDSGSAKVIDRGRGLYYGIAISDQKIFVAARGQHIVPKELRGTEDGSILIFDYDMNFKKSIKAPFPLRDMHQITYHAGRLWVTCSYDDMIAIYDGENWKKWYPCLENADLPDQYHFNSILFDGDKILVLAHNYGQSEIWICSLPDLQVERKVSLGYLAHNIWKINGVLYTCSSGSGSIESTAGFKVDVGGFPRGVAITDDLICLGVSEDVEQDRRDTTSGSIQIFNRNWDFLKQIKLLKEGVVLEIRIPGFKDICCPHIQGRSVDIAHAEWIAFPIITCDRHQRYERGVEEPMSSPPATNRTFFDGALDQDELERILQRIDENLALRPLLHNQLDDPASAEIAGAPPPLPSVADVPSRLHRLHMMRAPLFAIKGRSLRDQLKRLLNLPIRLFGHRQTRFNQELLELLGLLHTQLQGLYQHAEYHAQVGQLVQQLQAQIHDLNAKVDTLAEQHDNVRGRLTQAVANQNTFVADQQAQAALLEQLTADQQTQALHLRQLASDQEAQIAQVAQLAVDQQDQYNRLEQLAADQHNLGTRLEQAATAEQGQHEWLERMAAGQQGQHKWLEQLAADQHGQYKWIQLLQRKQEAVALSVREIQEQLALHPDLEQSLSEPRIVNPESYHQRLAAMGQQIKVNLGCGEKPLPDYINVDIRELPDIDVVADARYLPFETGTVAELASAHLVEHFREHQLSTRIVPYWKSLLRPGGLLRIVCPNWAAILEQLNHNQMSFADFKLLTFGAQDYQGDDHFAMYTPQTLSDLLISCGLTRVEVLATDRMNGICPEMELLGYV